MKNFVMKCITILIAFAFIALIFFANINAKFTEPDDAIARSGIARVNIETSNKTGVGNKKTEENEEQNKDRKQDEGSSKSDNDSNKQKKDNKNKSGTPKDSDDNGRIIHNGGSGEGTGGSGGNENGSGETGNDNGNGGGGNTDAPVDDKKTPVIVTDLENKLVKTDDLENDTFKFWAYIENGDQTAYLKVNVKRADEQGNGAYIESSGRNYSCLLSLGKNYITLYAKQGGATVAMARFVITYSAKAASADDPVVGTDPPSIVTNLDGKNETLENRNFTFTVTARTHNGAVIYSDGISVTMDGETMSDPTGSSTFEYQLYFDPPNIGEYEDHRINVTAWDDKGNSVFKTYTVRFHFIDDGNEIGEAKIYIDATTLGLGIIDDPYAYKIKQGEPASCAVLAMLKEYGFSVKYSGTPKMGFYLKSISRGDLAKKAKVPGELWQKILDDGLTLTGQKNRDRIAEHDYTQGSGWMYAINGTNYPGKALSNYYLSDGDKLYLRFTLSYGKDIAGYALSGSNSGVLSSYCGIG